MSNCIFCGKEMNESEFMMNFHRCDDCTVGKYTTVEERVKELEEDD